MQTPSSRHVARLIAHLDEVGSTSATNRELAAVLGVTPRSIRYGIADALLLGLVGVERPDSAVRRPSVGRGAYADAERPGCPARQQRRAASVEDLADLGLPRECAGLYDLGHLAQFTARPDRKKVNRDDARKSSGATVSYVSGSKTKLVKLCHAPEYQYGAPDDAMCGGT